MIDKLDVNSLQKKQANEKTPAKNVKKARKGEANYLPPPPQGETEESLEQERLELLSENNTVEIRREVAIRCLVVYLGENEDHLFEYVDSEGQIGDLESRVMKILVTKSGTASDPASATVMVEGTEVLQGLDVPRACALLMGLIYALNLSYPRELKYTCEVFQKVFLKLDGQKSSPKVTSLKQKLLGKAFEPHR
ncbi:hypothetical protein AAFF_G00044870 [Aldrovandia affinis]|uniref:Uncharacterized protein n=1 Tax=Aldrovandia affinis TaxID=143900 RepID=A0AAD7VXM9_9TELE|nr:hypothetical protein AAFF_G00044870 [Aldrovandia affinis]